MASSHAIAVRNDENIDRIETALAELGCHVTLQRVNRDHRALQANQLATIADGLSTIKDDVQTAQSAQAHLDSIIAMVRGSWTKAELEELINGIDNSTA